jgi:hypothetical protein
MGEEKTYFFFVEKLFVMAEAVKKKAVQTFGRKVTFSYRHLVKLIIFTSACLVRSFCYFLLPRLTALLWHRALDAVLTRHRSPLLLLLSARLVVE